MTPQQLKSSILQRAIQGKLVPQIPAEGTGEELYQQIQKEKQAMRKAPPPRGGVGGGAKKEKPLPPISEDEIPFEIPETWRWCRLGDVISLLSGQDMAPEKYNSNRIGIPYLTGASNIENEQIIINRWTDNPKTVAHKGDLLVTCKGTVGKLAFLHEKAVHIARQIMAITPVFIYSYYVKYILESQIESLKCKAKSMIPGIERNNILNLLLPLPPLAEQRRIVAKIEELMPLIDRYEKAWTQLEAMNKKFPGDLKKSILQMAIQGRLVPQIPAEGTGEELLEKLKIHHTHIKKCKDELNFTSMDFDIPENWKFVELNQLFNFVDYRGKTPHKINESSNGVFLITASNIKNGFMDYTRKEYISNQEYEDRKSRGVTKIGDLLFTTEAPMGNSAICDLEICSCGQRIITFQEYNKDTVVPKLFMFFILSPAFQQQLLDNCTGTTAKGIKADKLKHFLIPLPPLAEQRRIVAKIEELMPLIERLESP